MFPDDDLVQDCEMTADDATGWACALDCFVRSLRRDRSAVAWLGEGWMLLTVFPILGLVVVLGSIALLTVTLLRLPVSAARWIARDLRADRD